MLLHKILLMLLIQDENILPAEFHKILQEIENYRKLKKEIWRQNKSKLRQITMEQQEELLEQGKKESKENLCEKLQVL